MNVIASAICLWTSKPAAATLGLTSELKDGHVTEEPHYDWLKEGHVTITPIGQLKGHIQQLDVEPWSQIIPKVFLLVNVLLDGLVCSTSKCRELLYKRC